jgi:proteasome lid subunit RPN8/RPN11
MLSWVLRLFYPRGPAYRPVPPPQPRRVVMASSCVSALRPSLRAEIERGHEGIVYLLGQTDGAISVALSVYRPTANTTRGSFHVDAAAMQQVVEAANAHGLQVVGQLHTHPGEAFHSEGDIAGALIRFGGFVSIVLPDFGRHLPDLKGAALYMFSGAERRWVELEPADLSILPERLP